MPLILSLLKYLHLNEKLCRFLTIGIINGFVLFIYKLFNQKLLFDSLIIDKNIYPIHFLNLPVIFVISTLFFSKFFEKKSVDFQERFLIKFNFFPSIFFFQFNRTFFDNQFYNRFILYNCSRIFFISTALFSCF